MAHSPTTSCSEKPGGIDAARSIDLLRDLNCEALVAVNLVEADGHALATLNLDRQFKAEELLPALWQVSQEIFPAPLATETAETCEIVVTTDRYLFLVRPVGNGRIFVQIVLRAYSDLEATRHLLTTLENDLLGTV